MQDLYKTTWFDCKGTDPQSFPQPFVILTAYNPQGNPPSQDPSEAALLNEKANTQLKAELARFSEVHEVIGCSPDRSHQEPSWAAQVPLETAVVLGIQYRQDALFYIEQNTLYLVSCQLGAVPEAFARWEKRQLSAVPL